MTNAPKKRRKRHGLRNFFLILLALLIILVIAVVRFLGNPLHADQTALSALQQAEQSDGMYTFGDPEASVGLVLYPGAKVEYTAYAPLAKAIAEEAGVLCVVPRMPFNFALFDQQAAARVMAQYPAVRAWGVGGHSLGGPMAAYFASSRTKTVAGVFLLGAYSPTPLSQPVLSIYGDRDTVLNHAAYDGCLSNMPENFTEYVLPGGNHAQFGSYGEQPGDSPATISAAEQQAFTAQMIANWIAENSAAFSKSAD